MASTHSFGLRAATLLYLLGSTTALREGGQCKPNNFLELGCFVDGEDGRALTGHSWRNEGMTTKACRRSCSEYQYFGLENGHECFCGNSLAASVAGAGECNLPCGGNATETCGAVNRLGVYKNNAFGLSSSVSSSSVASSSVASSSVAPSSVASTSVSSSNAASSSVASSDVISSSVPVTRSTLTPGVSSSTISTPATPISSFVPTIVSSTSSSSSSPPSSSSSSSIESTTSTSTSTTSTTSLCPLATSVIVGDTPCWASMPDACSSLIRTPSIPWPAVTAPAITCRAAFSAPIPFPASASASSCFTGINAPSFNGASAYSCAQNAGVICATTTACATPAPVPTNVVVNGNFETGSLSSWTLWSSIGADSGLGTSVVTGTSYSGRYALKAVYNNAAGSYLRQWKQDIKLEPGATYAATYWFFQTFGQSAMQTKLRFDGGGTAFFKTFNHVNTAAGVWTKVTDQFVPAASFGSVYFTIVGGQGGGPNTIYVDNITIQKVVT